MITFTGLQSALEAYGRYDAVDASDDDRKRAGMRVAVWVLAVLRGLDADDFPFDSEVEEALVRPLPVSHEEWLVAHPLMPKGALACRLAEENDWFDATFRGLKGSATKARINACVAEGCYRDDDDYWEGHWEDGVALASNLYATCPIGVSFFAPANTPSIIVVVSRAGNLRTMELRGSLSNTQKRILSDLHGLLGEGNLAGDDEEAVKERVHAALWDAFNMAEVNKSFYAGIAARFNTLVKALVASGHEEEDSKMFSSRLIGRILFAWFLNQKGFLNPDEHYLDIDGLGAGEYYERKLKRLFFGTLNTAKNKRGDDGDPVTPFLNGGLFEEQETDFPGEAIPFPEDFFTGLYEHFGQYDFTTDESTPDYEQVAIDPEMLGRIFESLLAEQMDDTGTTARKAKGAFYTPREIVAYMCRESVRQYLYRALGDGKGVHEGVDRLLDRSDGSWETDSDARKGLWNSNTETVLPKAIAAIEHVRVLDPACGSGAFPMGMLQLLMRCRVRLMGKKATADAYHQKLEILRNSVFGVDIEPMAVEIARLRVWLSMIVERESIDQVEPLPNLDFKFVCADSLVPLAPADVDGSDRADDASIGDVRLNGGALQQGAFDLADEGESFVSLKDIRARYFSTTNPEEKHKLMERFEKIAQRLGGGSDSSPRGVQIGRFHPHSATRAEGQAPFFDPGFMFGTEMFDVVIGNPPYVQLQKMKDKAKLYEALGYRSYNRTGDLYELFYERGLDLLSDHGVLDFITSNKWMRNKYGKELRKHLARNAEVISLIDLGAGRFSSATVDTNIMLLAKGHAGEVLQAVRYADDSLNDIGNYVMEHATTIPFGTVTSTDKTNGGKSVTDGGSPWVILADVERSIKHKMEEAGTPLKQLDVRINYGVKTGLNDAFIISKEKRDELVAADPKSAEIIRPVLRGRDIKRYRYEFADRYLVASHNGYKHGGEVVPRVDVDSYPAVKEWLDSFEPKLSKRADQGDTQYNLRDCAYMDDFSQPKIVWGEISDKAKFAFDGDGAYVPEATTFLMAGERLPVVLGFLNSHLSEYYFSTLGTTTGMGTVRWKKYTIEQLPIVSLVGASEDAFLQLVQARLNDDCTQEEARELDHALDESIAETIGLNPQERNFIERFSLA